MSDVVAAVRRFERSALFAPVKGLAGLCPKGLARFLVVGVGGLSVDVAVLWLLEQAKVDHAWARLVSLSVATLATWALNRQFTFGDSGRAAQAEFGRYAAVALVAQSVNYAIFLGVCAMWPTINHSLAAVTGAVIATGFSYTGQRFFTFAPRTEKPRPTKTPRGAPGNEQNG